ncbi:Uncharacterised protein [Mycobacteroides abscessus]|nr:Uncharacterised protein [Mycobacteroides abscessus]
MKTSASATLCCRRSPMPGPDGSSSAREYAIAVAAAQWKIFSLPPAAAFCSEEL